MKIVVTGATGNLGKLAVEALIERGVAAGDITATGRRADALSELATRGVVTATIDFDDPATLRTPFAGADALLLVSGSEIGRRVPQHTNAITAAQQAGIHRIVYTSAPHATDTSLVLAPEHAATEELLNRSGLETTILRNNWYTENYAGLVSAGAENGEIVGSAGKGLVASASRSDYAEAAAVALIESGHAGKIYELAGSTAWDFDELAAVISDIVGSPVTYRSLSPREHRDWLIDQGADPQTAEFMVALDGNIRDGALADANDVLSELIRRPTTPLRDGLAQAVRASQV